MQNGQEEHLVSRVLIKHNCVRQYFLNVLVIARLFFICSYHSSSLFQTPTLSPDQSLEAVAELRPSWCRQAYIPGNLRKPA